MARSNPSWQPSSSVDVARHRAAMLARVRDYFAEREVLEVDTPAISAYATSDTNIDNVPVRLGGTTAWLHTSPESSMKCLLAAGYPDIFSTSRVYRDGERGARHLPEFTLLEWYRLGFQLAEIITDTVELIGHCLDQDDLPNNVTIVDYAAAFEDAIGVDVFTATCDDLAAAVKADAGLRESIGDNRDAWLDYALVSKIAPAFATDQLTVLQHYPREQAALARVCPSDARVADRFEVFYGTLELANGYVELTDAAEQRARFEKDSAARQAAGKLATEGDELLLAALEHGLPQCAGVAVGFERLQMIFEQTDHINNVVTFANRNLMETLE